MIIVTLRIICIILLIFAIIDDIDIPLVLHTQVNQLIIAILIVVILLVIDEIVGFLLGLIFLIIYFKYYQKKLNNLNINAPIITNQNPLKEPLIADRFYNGSMDVKPIANQKTEPIENHYIKEGYNCLEMPYISKELLDKAQNNIYDINNYNNNTEIQGLVNEPIQAYDGCHYSKL